MQACRSLSFWVACSLLLWGYVFVTAMPKTTMTMATLGPKLEVEPLTPRTYHFIVDHRPTSLGQNHYIKPGQIVGAFSLDSKALQVRQEGSKHNIGNKLNILFVANPKKEDATQS